MATSSLNTDQANADCCAKALRELAGKIEAGLVKPIEMGIHPEYDEFDSRPTGRKTLSFYFSTGQKA